MADDNTNEKDKFVRRAHPDLSIESIISAPLVAISKANVMMVKGQTDFLLNYCFDKKIEEKEDAETGETIEQLSHYNPVMVNMIMAKSELQPAEGIKGEEDYVPEQIKTYKMIFQIPLISIIPMNSLVIDKFNLDFELQITSTTTYNTQDQTIDKRTHLNGKIGKQSSQSTTSKEEEQSERTTKDLKVNIDVGQLPLPKGVLAIIDLYTNNIQPHKVIED
ncbi:MAG: DUF2589 domain-containing protein [Aureispira sp.]